MSDSAVPHIDTKARLGKLPVWMWGVIVGIVGIIADFLISRLGSHGSAGGDNSTTPTTNLDASGYATSGLTTNNAIDTSAVGQSETNASWLSRAAAQVASATGASPSAVRAAIQSWIYGQSITYNQQQYVDRALGTVGAPPEGTQGVSPILDPVDHAIKQLGTSTIYQVTQSGQRDAFQSWGDYVSAGRPQYQTVGSDFTPITALLKTANNPDVYAVTAGGKTTKINFAQLQEFQKANTGIGITIVGSTPKVS